MGLSDIDGVEIEENESEYPEETKVEELLAEYFREQGYDDVRTSNDHGEDIPDMLVLGEDVKWGIEVKGDSKSNKERIYTALGQVVYEMPYEEIERADLRWSIAFPETISGREQYRKRIDQNVSRDILEMLDIYVMFVEENGDVDILEPGEIGTE
mgnify:CR=1 FL=1